MKFLDYNKDVKDYSTVAEVAELLELTMGELQKACENFDIYPKQTETGAWVMDRWQVCHVHNKLYKAAHGGKKSAGPWG